VLEPLTFFIDIGEARTIRKGAIPDSGVRRELEAKLLADAGVAVKFGPASVFFPLWVSDPVEGEKKFDWRWGVALGYAL
jgi:hypothetical protein